MYDVKFLTDENGKKTDAVIPYEQYIELLDDIEDLKTIADRKDEELIDHEEVMKMFGNE